MNASNEKTPAPEQPEVAPPKKWSLGPALQHWGKQAAAMLRTRLQVRFLLWGVALGVAGGLTGAMVHDLAERLGWGFPWDYLVGIPVLIAFWVLPFWVAMNRRVLQPVQRIVEADRRLVTGDEPNSFFPPEAIPDNEIGDIMRSRNEMLARLREVRQQARQREERLAALNAIATAASESLLQDTLFDVAIQQALTATAMDSAALFVREGDVLSLVAHRGISAEVAAAIRQHRVGEDLPGQVAATGEVLTIEAAVARDPRVQVETIRRAGYEAFVGVPLKGPDRIVGVLALGAFQTRTFTETDVSFLQMLGNVVGTAVANNRLYAEARGLSQRLEQLHGAGLRLIALLGQPLADEVLLQQALTALCHVVRAKYGAVGLVDDQGRLIRFIHWGMTEEEVARIGHPPRGVGLLGALLKKGPVLRLADLTTDPRHAGFPPHHPPMKTLLGVPVAGRDKVYGRLYLTEKEGGQPFTEQDENIARSFADSVALGLDNLRLLEQAHAAEARYRDLYEHAPVGLDEVNAEGLITSMNQTLLDWLGYSREEVVGKMRYEQLLTEEGRRQWPLLEARCRREGRLEHVELDLVRKDGSRLPVRIGVVAVYGPNGEVIGCRATTRDVTREKELERQFLQTQKMEALGMLAGGVAHDFNNILTVMLMRAEMAGMVADLPPRVQESLREIEASAKRAANLTRQLLLFSRRQMMQPRRLDVNARWSAAWPGCWSASWAKTCGWS